MKRTFDFYRTLNTRLDLALDQEQNYEKYLKRIQSIVNKKPQLDLSNSDYMQFLNRCRQTANKQKSLEKTNQVNAQNSLLLDKIVHTKSRKSFQEKDSYGLALYEKRYRWQQNINKQNKRIAERVIKKGSLVDNKLSFDTSCKQSPKRLQEKVIYEAYIKERKLPKLLKQNVE